MKQAIIRESGKPLAKKGDWVCRSCGNISRPGRETKGTVLIEIILWLCAIVPGLIYSLWRGANRRPVCALCGSQNIIPAESPRGREMVQIKNGLSALAQLKIFAIAMGVLILVIFICSLIF